MLNSDLCLLYGNTDGLSDPPLNALHDECCAWVHTNLEDRMSVPSGITMQKVLDNNNGMFCGEPQHCAINQPGCNEFNLGSEFGACCDRSRRGDCGSNPSNPRGGLNPEAVFKFAADDTMW